MQSTGTNKETLNEVPELDAVKKGQKDPTGDMNRAGVSMSQPHRETAKELEKMCF